MPVPTLTTEHLLLRPLTVDDATSLHAMYHDPTAMRYWHEAPHPDVAATRQDLAALVNPDSCWWAICQSPGEEAIGTIGYLDITNPFSGMGYFLHPTFWRQGIMTEAARAVLDHGFTQIGLEGVELWIHQDNIASQRLAHKLGFTRRGQFRQHYSHDATPHDTLVYGLYRWEWDASAANSHPHVPRFDAIKPILAVPDVAAAMSYYRDRLGFTVVWHSDDPLTHAIVAHRDWMAAGVCIHLNHVPDAVANTGIILRIDVGSDIDALYDRYVAAGVRIVMPPVSRPWGEREFEIVDEHGYHLRFIAPC